MTAAAELEAAVGRLEEVGAALVLDAGDELLVLVVPADFCTAFDVRVRCSALSDRPVAVALTDDVDRARQDDAASTIARWAEAGGTSRFVPPATDLEGRLLEVWSEILEVDGLGVTDHFLDVGGDSFDALEMLAMMEERFGTVLDVEPLFSLGTIRAVAQAVEAMSPAHP